MTDNVVSYNRLVSLQESRDALTDGIQVPTRTPKHINPITLPSIPVLLAKMETRCKEAPDVGAWSLGGITVKQAVSLDSSTKNGELREV